MIKRYNDIIKEDSSYYEDLNEFEYIYCINNDFINDFTVGKPYKIMEIYWDAEDECNVYVIENDQHIDYHFDIENLEKSFSLTPIINDRSEEDSNMEEWIEESRKKNDFEVGDRVVVNYPLGLIINKKGTIVDIYDPHPLSTSKSKEINWNIIRVLLDDGSEFKCREAYTDKVLSFLDKPENSNYEEWVEESLFDLEESDYEEWVEESKDKEPPYKFEIGEIVLRNYDAHDKITIATRSRNYERYKQFGYGPNQYQFYQKNGSISPYYIWEQHLKKINDFEDSNMEEWIEESKDYEFKIGDRVKIVHTSDSYENILIGEKGTVINIEDDIIILVKLDNYIDHYWKYESIMDTNIFIAVDDDLELIDEIEDSNMEEWIEESKKFKKDDIVVCTNKKLGEYITIGKKYKVLRYIFAPDIHDLTRSIERIEIISDNNSIGLWPLSRFELVDEPEDSNYEEWIEEARKYKIGDLVKIKQFQSVREYERDYDRCEVGFNEDMLRQGGKIARIERKSSDTYILYDLNGNQLPGSWCDDMFDYYDDTPEEQNYEEWAEESKKDKFEIGDEVYISSKEQNKRHWSYIDRRLDSILDEPGIIIDKINNKKCVIKFHKNIPELQECVNELIRSRFREGHFEQDTIDYFNNTDERNIWIGRMDAEVVKIQDNPEEQNYEEWVEESNNYKLKVGDRVKCVFEYCQQKGKIGTVVGDCIYYHDGTCRIEVKFDGDKKTSRFGSPDSLIKYNDYETSNYEEWLDES